jgi:hypothetical protein
MGVRVDLAPAWYVSGMLGYSHALEGHDHGGNDTTAASARLAKRMHEGHDHGPESVESPVLVNPHADREVHLRAALGRVRGNSTVELFAFGQVDATHPESYLRMGVSWERSLGRFSSVQFIADAPLTAARRNDLEVGVGVKTGW